MEFKNIIKEHIQWRHQILVMAKSDLKKTYNGTALGWAWAIIKPAVTIFIYWFAFAIGLRQRSGVDGFPFFIWLLAGIIPWFYIQEMWGGGTGCMRRYKFLITKMRFPTSTIPTFYSLSSLFVHVILALLVVAIFLIGGYGVSVYTLQIVFYMLCMFLLMTGWCMFAGVVGAMSKDFANLVKSFSMALFWLSGIMIPLNKVDNQTVQMIFNLNPVTFIVEGYRNSLIYKQWFFENPTTLAIFFVELLVIWVLAIRIYSKMKKEMADVL